ncbi:anthranilate phosphoribosyltransferase [Allosphingosinicella indica]|uniref:Anthranilate phosphoribosyltransferase n=1 Tax=Allosphingosinicella indica TaxID=941907 RepID=A0A1X7G6F3_9SPHN|nr:anthranilate phosphoribosyltransferase [Allosphingosinicella indica]SMF64878.1 anthranilate phosphoribosyltransferase [Allosphingosinicella indica]
MYPVDQLTRPFTLATPPQTDPAETALTRLLSGDRLDERAASHLFTALVAGALSETAIAAMLVALRLQGETAPVLIGAARALRAADAPFPRPDYLFADSCGTGGDGSGSINVSTAAALVAAAAGLPVAKHGNRSFTSRCGSADVLETLGAKLDVDASVSRRALDQAGFCFLFAPLYHPGLRHAGPVRRALKVRTVMNILGPCVNPAEPRVQLLGVADRTLLVPVARTLAALGVQRALVVHGSGLDEVALHGETEAARLQDGEIETIFLYAEDVGIEPRPMDAIAGGGPEENAARLKALLDGKGSAAEADVVALNAGALLMTAGIAADFPAGVRLAADVLASGAAGRTLAAFVEAVRG